MATQTVNWTDNVSVIAAQVLARGSTVRGTIDLRGKFYAYLMLALGRGGTTAPTTGVSFTARRMLNNGAAGGGHPAGIGVGGQNLAAVATTCATSDSASGQPVLNVASITGFVAGDVICIQDSGGDVTRLEWAIVSKTATGILTLDRQLEYTHTSAAADTVRSKADVFAPMLLDGGSLWEVVIDYGSPTAGESVTVRALAQRFDSLSIV